MNFVVLDTDVASAALRNRLPANITARLVRSTPCITFVTLGELTKWTVVRDWGPRKLEHLAAWRRNVVLLPFDERVSVTWGHIEARAQKRGHPHPVNDSWIAAVCIARDLPLITFNTKDYEDHVAHEGLHLVDAGRPVRP